MHIRGQDREVPLRGQRERRMLAALLSKVNRPVARSRLIWSCWDDPPPTARRQLHNCIWDLRRQLTVAAGTPAVITTTADGYQINLGEGQLDAQTFTREVAAAQRAQPIEAAQRLRAALRMWVGPALEGISGPIAQTWAAKLDEERIAATEHCLGIELSLGLHHATVAELTELVAEYPLRERLVQLLMTALYRCGRQADALRSYQQMVTRLADLGIDPTDLLRSRQLAILRNDPALYLTA
ncbi:MAG TPA: AfsR/SARP family transcriptional regulator [Candidatus Limnocylindrales bacterium]|nr:AfsR/SARP family transcriptional regulator [Candidatus Limnocylindrales bacterium]